MPELVDDPRSVRDVLGVTELDVDDTLVYSLMYAPTAEAVVKAAIPTWATVLAASDATSVFLKGAAVAYTAALLIPRLRSGALGLIEGDGRSIDWDKKQKDLQTLYGWYITQVLDAVSPTDPADLLPTMSFTMQHTPPSKSWQSYPPIAFIMNPLLGEDWDH